MLKIDSGLHLLVSGAMDPAEQPTGSYYAPFHGAFVTQVDHFVVDSGSHLRSRPLYLETGNDQVLDRTVKHDEILSGPFGAVNATKTCFYTRPIENGAGSVAVEYNGNETDHEVPNEISKPTFTLPALTSLSLVRIFRDAFGGYVVVSANYERDGRLGSVNTGFVTMMFGSSDPQVNDEEKRELGPSLVEFGIPVHIDVGRYLLYGRLPMPAATHRQQKNVMNEFYGFGKIIRQDELKDNVVVASRWLQPSVTTEEDESLNRLCEARFRQQQARGISTVQ